MKRDFLMMTDLTEAELGHVLADAAALKRDRLARRDALAGQSVGLFFEHPSTRTRISTEVAAVEVGAHPVVLKGDEVGLGSREAPEDVARVLARYLSLVAMRVKSHAVLEAIAASADIPVVNLLSNVSHPCQGLADLQTIAEHRPLPGTRVAYVGDGNNVAHSLLLGGAMMGMEIVIATPEGREPDPQIVAKGSEIAARNGGSVALSNVAAAAVTGSDVVYADVWTSMGQESSGQNVFADYQVDASLFSMAKPEAIFMHCLPAHRGEEVTHEVLEHERSFVFDQAENRLHAVKALMLFLLDPDRV